jgi:hypothetical protein
MFTMPALTDAPSLAGLASLTGRWERTLLRDADGTVDTTSRVTWLQGPSVFVDLRLSGNGPATGFAGTLTRAGQVFTWSHEVDLGPWDGADSGTLEWGDGHLVERGVHAGYLEHWRPAGSGGPCSGEPPNHGPRWGLRLARQGGQRAVLVRVGEDVGWACGPGGPAPGEICLARATRACGALVTCSSDPARLDTRLTWSDTVGAVVVELDGPAGTVRTRWQVTHREGT